MEYKMIHDNKHWKSTSDPTIDQIKVGDFVETPRFLSVRIDAIFVSETEMRMAGYREPTHYRDKSLIICGRNDYPNMYFACAPANPTRSLNAKPKRTASKSKKKANKVKPKAKPTKKKPSVKPKKKVRK